jgi:predicted membrane chloride channel (bestrophin family)
VFADIKLFLHVYVFTLPIALLPSMGYVTPVASLWIGTKPQCSRSVVTSDSYFCIPAYALFGIDEIGVEIEEPFGEDYVRAALLVQPTNLLSHSLLFHSRAERHSNGRHHQRLHQTVR